MATSAGAEFTKIFTFDGSSYTDVTLEAQSPAGTAFSILGASNHWLYLGHDSKFDMAMFDVATAGNLGALSWYYYNGSAWIQFVPASARYELDSDDNEGSQYAFDKDGAEILQIILFPKSFGFCLFINPITPFTSVTILHPFFSALIPFEIASLCNNNLFSRAKSKSAVE